MHPCADIVQMLRVTLTDIAKEAGVHHSTVSRALKKHRGIPATTRDRIRKIAEKLGYIPDPNLSALAAYKKTRKKQGFLTNLAWITNFPTEEGWSSNPHFVAYHKGAKQRATELGYGLEEFWLAGSIHAGKSPTKILRARGISGLLFCPQPEPGIQLDLEWNYFTPVSLGYTLATTPLHNAALDHFASIQLLVRELYGLGYRRPCLVLPIKADAHMNFSWSAGYTSAANELSISACPPLHLAQEDLIGTVKKTKPDVLLTTRVFAQYAHEHLPQSGILIPEDMGLAAINCSSQDIGMGGILELGEQVGGIGLDMVNTMLQQGERGLPKFPKHVLIRGEFQIGATLQQTQGFPDPKIVTA
jgi:LacI family transcriptional regulator